MVSLINKKFGMNEKPIKAVLHIAAAVIMTAAVIGIGGVSAEAAEQSETSTIQNVIYAPGVNVNKSETKAADEVKAGSISNNIVTGSGADAVYSFDGKKYTKTSLYGTRKLTGYSAEETGTAKTCSGKAAQALHTVAAPSDIPIGTVIIVEGKSGPYPSKYNGVYVVEDRGGSIIESQGLIDIFFNSTAEAYAVTDAGWNYADVYIAKACN